MFLHSVRGQCYDRPEVIRGDIETFEGGCTTVMDADLSGRPSKSTTNEKQEEARDLILDDGRNCVTARHGSRFYDNFHDRITTSFNNSYVIAGVDPRALCGSFVMKKKPNVKVTEVQAVSNGVKNSWQPSAGKLAITFFRNPNETIPEHF